MRPIHLARLDRSRPVLVLTRELVRPHLDTVTIAPITFTIRGLSTEVLCGSDNGFNHQCVVACDHITTIPDANLGRQIGWLTNDQESVDSRTNNVGCRRRNVLLGNGYLVR